MRVHNHILKRQKLPPPLLSKRIWDERLSDIAHFEDYLTRQGTIILKFFLHVSRKEQKKRFMERLDGQTNIGNSRPPTYKSASFGATTCTRSRKQFGLQRRNAHRGTWCQLITNGLPGSLSPRPLWKQ